jgi:hypothetical protein
MPQYCKFVKDDINCDKQASYGDEKEEIVLYCKSHKRENDICLRSSKCIYSDEKGRCRTQPSYGCEKERKLLYCILHKRNTDIDLKSTKCIFDKCNNQAVYGIDKTIHCYKHKEENEIDLRSNKCKYIDENGIKCILTANYGYKIREYCSHHKKDNNIRLSGYQCLLCNKNEAHYGENNKREYCAGCFAFLFPKSKQARTYLFKQNTIINELKLHFIFDIIDKKINGGCSDRKPDLIIDCFTHIINIEIDEEQHKHKSYTPECVENRYNELFSDFADRPFICIRFNPDKYIIGKNIYKGCFTNKTTINNEEFNKRIQILINEIKYNKENIPNELFTIKYLFYDKLL